MHLIKLTFYAFSGAITLMNWFSSTQACQEEPKRMSFSDNKKGSITTNLIITITDIYDSLSAEGVLQSVPANESYKSVGCRLVSNSAHERMSINVQIKQRGCVCQRIRAWPWLGSCCSRVICSLRGNLEELSQKEMRREGWVPTKIKTVERMSGIEKKNNLFHYHTSRTGVHLRASHKYVMIESTKPPLSQKAK